MDDVRMCEVVGCESPHLARGLCNTHYKCSRDGRLAWVPRPATSARERVWSWVAVSVDGCWLWLGSTASDGYANVMVESRTWKAHRYFYELLVGPIPEGLVLDHLCRNRACVRPDHLEAVTNGENGKRGNNQARKNELKTHCIHGHPLSGENLNVTRVGVRECIECRRRRGRDGGGITRRSGRTTRQQGRVP